MQAQTSIHPQQLRGFVAVWLGITLLIGIATFVAIYVGTGSLDNTPAANAFNGSAGNGASQNVNNPISNNEPAFSFVTNNNSPVEENNAPSGDEPETSALVAPASEALPPAQDGATPVPPQLPTRTPQPTTPPIQNKRFDLGVQVVISPDPNNMTGYLDAAANQLNLNWVKLQIRWEFVEPEPGVYDWAMLDSFFALTPAKDLKVLASIVTAPDWAREPGADLTKHGPPADYQVFANFVATVMTRYPGQIHAVEVWNEQNLDREWASVRGISPSDYVQMVQIVAQTIRFIDANVIVISGAPSPTGVETAAVMSDFRYTDGMIAAGLLNVVDCFGAHHNGYNIGPRVPYDQVPNDPNAVFRGPFNNPHPSWSFYSTLTTYANKIQAAGSDVPLCVTEFGWATVEDLPAGYPPGFEFAIDNSLREHGNFIVDAIKLMDEWDFVWLAMLWNLNFAPEANFEPTNDNVPYSLIRYNYAPSPAWIRIAEFNFRLRNR